MIMVNHGLSRRYHKSNFKRNWKNDFKFITSGRGIQTKKGTLLHCLVNLQKGTHVFGSNDNGKTWFITETPTSPGDESKIVELNDGSWMVNSELINWDIDIHISVMMMEKLGFQKEESIIDPGCNGSLIRYSHGEKMYYY